MDKIDPNQFPRRILLAVTGLSPQVVTETLYALAVGAERPWVPTEVHLITTGEGARRARLALLPEGKDWFGRLRRDYGLPPVHFGAETIHVLTDTKGEPLDDIRSPADNERAADVITHKVRELTDDGQSQLHVSIAGGRKTMGYYLGYALSLFGRPQDRLSHVLVSEPFESMWEFFYPTPESNVVETRDRSLVDTREAEVTLAEIPFVRMTGGMDERLLEGTASFSEAVAAAQQLRAPVFLRIDLKRRIVEAGGKAIALPPVELALYTLFARRAKQGEPPIAAPPKETGDSGWAQRFLHEYRQLKGEMSDTDRTEAALAGGMDGNYFSEKKSVLHRYLNKSLGVAAAPYRIGSQGAQPRKYALSLPPAAIEIV